MISRSIESIWMEFEQWPEGGAFDALDSNSDVIVRFTDGTKYVATFFTYKNIYSESEANKQSGECLSGKYFWASDMILIDQLSRIQIQNVIDDLIGNGEFESIFKNCSK